MRKVGRFRNAATQTVVSIHGEAHIAHAVNHRQSRVVGTLDVAARQGKTRFGRHVPVNPVVAGGKADVGTNETVALFAAVVIAKDHDIFAIVLRDACVKN